IRARPLRRPRRFHRRPRHLQRPHPDPHAPSLRHGRRRSAPPHPHPPHTQRRPLGLRARLRHHLGPRARPHLRAPHLDRPRPLGSIPHPRVPLPHRPPPHRAQPQAPLPHPRQSAHTHPHRLRPHGPARLRPLQRPHRKTRQHQRAAPRVDRRPRRPTRL